MNKLCLAVVAAAMSYSAIAGAGGVVVKGVAKTWDEVARVALKVSGRSATDDAVKAASKTIESAVSTYGDDVAESAMRGGVEVAEQSLKRGPGFVDLIMSAGKYSDDAVKAIALNSDDAVKYAAKYGDGVVKLSAKAPGAFARGIALIERSGAVDARGAMKVMATEIPAEQIPQVLGAIEKNPHVAGRLLDCLAKGGKHFVDRLFAVNAKQIMAGGLTAAAIVAVYRETAPEAAEGEAITAQNKAAIDIVNGGSPEERRRFVEQTLAQNCEVRTGRVRALFWATVILSCFGGIAIVAFVLRKTGTRVEKPSRNAGHCNTISSAIS